MCRICRTITLDEVLAKGRRLIAEYRANRLEGTPILSDEPRMQDIDWSDCPLVRCDPNYLHSAPTLRSAPRVPIEALVVNHLDGEAITDLAYMYEVPPAEVQTVIAYYHERLARLQRNDKGS